MMSQMKKAIYKIEIKEHFKLDSNNNLKLLYIKVRRNRLIIHSVVIELTSRKGDFTFTNLPSLPARWLKRCGFQQQKEEL